MKPRERKGVIHLVSTSANDYLECGIEETIETTPTYGRKFVTCKNCLRVIARRARRGK